MSDLVCPHCLGGVPWSAKVCRGCQAEVDYGTPGLASAACLVASAYGGYRADLLIPDLFVGWVAGITLFVTGTLALKRLYRRRAVFSRRYQTR